MALILTFNNMGTTATIIAKREDKYLAIYCNWDGYTSYMLKMLRENYKDNEKVNKLINLGDVSCVKAEVDIPEGVEHSFKSPAPDITIAYGRDRGEYRGAYRSYDNIERAVSEESGQYMYLWDGEDWSQIEKIEKKNLMGTWL